MCKSPTDAPKASLILKEPRQLRQGCATINLLVSGSCCVFIAHGSAAALGFYGEARKPTAEARHRRSYDDCSSPRSRPSLCWPGTASRSALAGHGQLLGFLSLFGPLSITQCGAGSAATSRFFLSSACTGAPNTEILEARQP